VVLWIKACPKCGGDLYNDRDVMGYYRQCLQCGYTFYEQRRRPARDDDKSSDGRKPASPQAA
jgi:DNA-directed RNA polymerase subunit M/transcription elongation factor TFIIS